MRVKVCNLVLPGIETHEDAMRGCSRCRVLRTRGFIHTDTGLTAA